MLIKRMLKNKKVTFLVTERQRKFIRTQAEKNEVSLAEYVRQTVLKDMPKK